MASAPKTLRERILTLKAKGMNSLEAAEALGEPLKLVNKLWSGTEVQLQISKEREENGRRLHSPKVYQKKERYEVVD